MRSMLMMSIGQGLLEGDFKDEVSKRIGMDLPDSDTLIITVDFASNKKYLSLWPKN